MRIVKPPEPDPEQRGGWSLWKKVWSCCLLQPPTGTGSMWGWLSSGDWLVSQIHIPLVRMGQGHSSVTEGPHHACPARPPFAAPKPTVLEFEPHVFLLLVGKGKEERSCANEWRGAELPLYICDHELWSPTVTALARNWCHLNTFPGKPISLG